MARKKAQIKAESGSRKNPAMTIASIEAALIKHRGVVASVALSFGVSRETIYKRIRKSVRLQKATMESRETMKDYGESKLYQLIDQKHWPALKFFLQTQARDRGYIVNLPQHANTASLETLKRLLKRFDVEAGVDEIIDAVIEIDNEMKAQK